MIIYSANFFLLNYEVECRLGDMIGQLFFRTKQKREMENRKSIQDYVRKASVHIKFMEGTDVILFYLKLFFYLF